MQIWRFVTIAKFDASYGKQQNSKPADLRSCGDDFDSIDGLAGDVAADLIEAVVEVVMVDSGVICLRFRAADSSSSFNEITEEEDEELACGAPGLKCRDK